MFDDTITLELDYPITEEQLDAILDIDMEHTVNVTFHTKNGKEVEFEKRKKGEWEERQVSYVEECGVDMLQSARCSKCKKYHTTPYMYFFDRYNFCPHCGADMRGERDE